MGGCFSRNGGMGNRNSNSAGVAVGGGYTQQVVAPTRTWGVQPSGVWDKTTMLQQIRANCGRCYDQGDESEGKGGRLWNCPNYGWVNVWNNGVCQPARSPARLELCSPAAAPPADVRRLSLRTAVNCLYLDVSNNDVRTLEEINGGVNLVYLDASSNDIGQGGRLGLPMPGAPRSRPSTDQASRLTARAGGATGSVVLACLEGLNLANNDIGPHIPAGAFDWCPNVRAVSLNDNDIISFPDDPCWPQLQVLNLANNDLRVVPTLPRCPYVRQIYLDKNELGDDQIPYICRLIDLHPYLIKLKLGHNNFSDGGIAQICEYARAKNPYLFHSSQPTLQATFSQPVSLYGANSQGERNSNPGVVQACWVVEPEPSNGPAFAEAFVVAEVTPVTGLVRPRPRHPPSPLSN